MRAQVLTPDPALIAVTHTVDNRGVGLQSHSLLQTADEHPCHLLPLMGRTGFAFYDRCHDQGFVGIVIGQPLFPSRPFLGQYCLHPVEGTLQQIQIGLATGKGVGIGEESSFGMLTLGSNCRHDLLAGPLAGDFLKSLGLRQSGSHILEGPAFYKLDVPVLGVSRHHDTDHVPGAHAIKKLVLTGLDPRLLGLQPTV